MSDPVGFARLPADVSSSLRACAAGLMGCTAQLDVVISRGVSALEAMGEQRAACAEAAGGLLEAVRSSRRTGPDRARLAELARSVDRTAEAIESVAWAWARHPMPELVDLLRAQRDATRDIAKAVEALDETARRLAWEQRCREREAEASGLDRVVRRVLLAEQGDVLLATAAHDTLTYAAAWRAAIGRLRAAVLRFSLE